MYCRCTKHTCTKIWDFIRFSRRHAISWFYNGFITQNMQNFDILLENLDFPDLSLQCLSLTKNHQSGPPVKENVAEEHTFFKL